MSRSDQSSVSCWVGPVFSLGFRSAGKGQLLTGIFFKNLIALVNLQEVAGGKKFFKLLLEALNFIILCMM